MVGARRRAGVGALVATLSVTALAPAAEAARGSTFTGPISGGGRISIVVKQHKRHGPIRIGQIRIREVPSPCATRVARLAYTTSGSFRLPSNREFSFEIDDRAGAKLEMSGKLNRKLKGVRGGIRLYGSYPVGPNGSRVSCNSGSHGYGAKP